MSYPKISYKKIVVIFALGFGIISTAQAGNWQLKLGTRSQQ